MRLLHILTALFLLPSFAKSAPNALPEWQQQFFIDTWSHTAVDNMNRYGIPASITLAQAIVESGWGQGRVAVEGNNFFCIKANNGWTGEVVRHMDDERDSSQFRKYMSVEESFSDHSAFLRQNQRYRSLFELEATDYRGWAKGLKSAGYATDSAYAERLIAVIERHRLHVYDAANGAAAPKLLMAEALPAEEPVAEAAEAPLFATQTTGDQPIAKETYKAPARPQLPVPTYRIGGSQRQQPAATAPKPSAKMKMLMPRTGVGLERR
jgi:hypothetical protein